jgi:23S rRNA pseudouridine1911/1915/1917 synthase
MQTFTVPSTEQEQRLDLYLKNHLLITRSQAQKIIKDGRVKLNGMIAKPHTPVSAGMEIVIVEQRTEEGAGHEQDDWDMERMNQKISVLYEDGDLVVINKPAGLLVHPATGREGKTLIDWLKNHTPSIKDVGPPERPGLVSRLDRLASGVMVIAKTPEAFVHLKQQFQNKTIEKEYCALVHGYMPKETGTIRLSIGRSREKARMAARSDQKDGREAITHYEVQERFKNFTLLLVRTETGRTHQIRAHFHALGHPVVGDPLYRIKGIKLFPLGRLFLHAEKLSLELLNGGRKTFTAPLPQELEAVLQKLPKT